MLDLPPVLPQLLEKLAYVKVTRMTHSAQVTSSRLHWYHTSPATASFLKPSGELCFRIRILIKILSCRERITHPVGGVAHIAGVKLSGRGAQLQEVPPAIPVIADIQIPITVAGRIGIA